MSMSNSEGLGHPPLNNAPASFLWSGQYGIYPLYFSGNLDGLECPLPTGMLFITKVTVLINFLFFVSFSPFSQFFPMITSQIHNLQPGSPPESTLEETREKTGPFCISQSEGCKVMFCCFHFPNYGIMKEVIFSFVCCPAGFHCCGFSL